MATLRVKQTGEFNWKHYEEFVAEFKNESDRAAVILGVAKLDLVMQQILLRSFVASPSATDELLDGEAPLATFSAKINMLYRLGLIEAQFARTLHLIRKIRNAFAHEVSGCKLDSGSHRDRVKDLSAPFKDLAFKIDLQKHFFGDATGPSADFRIVLAILVGRLELLADMIHPLEASQALPLIEPHWSKKIEPPKPNQPDQAGAVPPKTS